MTNKNITYLLGAGASYQAMPVLAELSQQMGAIMPGLLNNTENEQLAKSRTNPFEFGTIPHLAYELHYLGNLSEGFNTIDTYAKMLLANQSTVELSNLKRDFNLFLTIWQLIKEKSIVLEGKTKRKLKEIDPRYIALIASLLNLNAGIQVMSNVKFVTWNYDLQLELAFRKFFQNKITMKQVDEYFHYLPTSDMRPLQVVHLNGLCGYFGKTSTPEHIDDLHDIIEARDASKEVNEMVKDLFAKIHPKLNEFIPQLDGLLNFAWESGNTFVNEARRQAIEIANMTDELVIVGYSFPIFNRDIDALFFNNLKRVQVIHYQDPNADANFLRRTFNIKESFHGLTGTPVIDIRVERENMTQFIIPN